MSAQGYFPFVGGPYDGQTLRVELRPAGDDYIAPEIWRLREPLKLPPPGSRPPGRMRCDPFVAFRGATAWEAQIGPAWIRIRYPTYWRFGWPVSVGWDSEA